MKRILITAAAIIAAALSANAQQVYTILCTIEDTFHIKWNKDKKMAMADDGMITVADIFESVELAIKNYS